MSEKKETVYVREQGVNYGALTKTVFRYITRNKKIHGGEPIIKDTRFPVRSVIFYVLKEGMLPEELQKEFP